MSRLWRYHIAEVRALLKAAIFALIFAVLALMLAASAQAQTYAQALTCLPGPRGPGVGLTIRSTAEGIVMWHYCPDGRGGWTDDIMLPLQFNATAGIPNSYLFALGRIISAASLQEAQDAASIFTVPNDDPRLSPIWSPYLWEMQANKPTTATQMMAARRRKQT